MFCARSACCAPSCPPHFRPCAGPPLTPLSRDAPLPTAPAAPVRTPAASASFCALAFRRVLLRRAFALPLSRPQSRRARSPCLPVQAPCRTRDVAPLASGVAAVHVRFCATAAVLLRLRSPHLRALTPSRPHALLAQAVFGPLALALATFARPMAFYVLFALLALCTGQTVSPTTSPSPTPTPCSAPPGYFCSGGSALICPIGAYCAGGSALNVSCYPVTACTVAGLSAQPLCYWKTLTINPFLLTAQGVTVDPLNGTVLVADSSRNRIVSFGFSNATFSVLAGSGAAAFANGLGVQAAFANPTGITIANTTSFVADYGNNRIRRIDLVSSLVTTFAGSGAWTPFANGIGAAATFNLPYGVAVASDGGVYVADQGNHRVRVITPAGVVSTAVGNGVATSLDGIGTSATINWPVGVSTLANTVYIAELGGCRIRVLANGVVTTLAGSSPGYADGYGTLALFNGPSGVAISAQGAVFVADKNNNRIRKISPLGDVTTVIGNGVATSVDGFSPTATTSAFGLAITPHGSLYVVENIVPSSLRQLLCVPCPASYFCFSGAPVLCPGGSYCPLSSINATLCTSGSFSNAGASSCTLCPAGTFTSTTGSTSCQQCPGGHYCPAGTSSWAGLNCGRSNYCPDGSGAPTPCPNQVPPSGGWGALQVQGPAFLVETAHCLNHCFWNFTSGDGMLSKC